MTQREIKQSDGTIEGYTISSLYAGEERDKGEKVNSGVVPLTWVLRDKSYYGRRIGVYREILDDE